MSEDNEATSTIVDFLRAQIAEDEAKARAALRQLWMVTEGPDREFVVGHLRVPIDPTTGDFLNHVGRHYPARELAECAAKRQIIEQAAEASDDRSAVAMDRAASRAEEQRMRAEDPGALILAALASVYAGHPDYRPEWAA